nr:phosphate ABC transporter, permease protein PstA [Deltaproteobacteria bacterium]
MNKSSSLLRRRKLVQVAIFGLFRLSAAINGIALLIVVYFLVARGWRAINWTFLTQPPMDSMTKGGILPCIVGTLCLSLGA